jgi:hypothetical protein
VVTKTLEKLVLPVLETAPFTYEITGNGKTITFDVKLPRFTSQWRVVDHTTSQVLSIEAVNLVSFAAEGAVILAEANELNQQCAGKFSLVSQEHLTYCLELPYSPQTPQASFQHAMFLALDTVAAHDEGWRMHSRPYKTIFEKIDEIFSTPDTNSRR